MSRYALPRTALPAGFELSDEAAVRIGENPAQLELEWHDALLLRSIGEVEAHEPARADWNRWRVPPWLDGADLEFLSEAIARDGWPPETTHQLKLMRYGIAGRPGFKLGSEWVDAKGQGVAAPDVSGGPIIGRWRARMTLAQWLVVAELGKLSGLGVSEETDLRATEWLLSRIPPGDTSVTLDAFLAREEIITIDDIAPKLVPLGDGTYQVQPEIAEGVGLSQDELDHHYYRARADDLGRGRIRRRLPNGRRVNVMFSERATEAMHALRKHDIIDAQTAARALSRPEEFFGKAVDLKNFGRRVTGVGPVLLRPIEHGKEVEVTGWFDFETGDQQPLAGARFDLDDPEVRVALRRAINQADADGAGYIPNPWGAGFIEITAGLRAQLERSERAADRKSEERTREGLNVAHNIDDVEHAEDGSQSAAVAVPEPRLMEGIKLRRWQVEGYRWLMRRLLEGRSGALLADDMGLGKTLQVLSVLSGVEALGRSGPHLIVAPVALTENWLSELERFLGESFGPVLVADSASLAGVRDIGRGLERSRVVIASYEQVKRHELAFARIDWDVVVLDEAQRVKNAGTQVSRVVRALKARFRIASTGTPVENSLTELWTICDWIAPGHLESLRAFTRRFVDRVRHGSADDRSAAATELTKLLEPLMLRRTKDVLGAELPPAEHTTKKMPLGDVQTQRYQVLVKTKAVGQINAFALLQRLFAVCAHPDLGANDAGAGLLRGVDFPKARVLLEILDRIHARAEKVLVFANRKHVQRWLASLIEERYGARVPIINGDITGSRERMHIVQAFARRAGFGTLVLAPRAAGVGLNITAANHVIHYMREWNPAIESQATGRAHRMGQRLPVEVYTLVSEGGGNGLTVEERLAELLHKKQALMHEFVVPLGGFEVTAEEILALEHASA